MGKTKQILKSKEQKNILELVEQKFEEVEGKVMNRVNRRRDKQ